MTSNSDGGRSAILAGAAGLVGLGVAWPYITLSTAAVVTINALGAAIAFVML